MKNAFIFSIAIFISGLLNVMGQNLVVNGDLESWTGGVPDGWTVYENITQESTNIHGGSYSARHTSADGTMDFQQMITGVQGGADYTISYWFLDNDPEARTRIWSFWMAGTTTLAENADILRPSTYSTDNPDWQHFDVVLTAPENADGFRFEVRVYKQDNIGGGSVFYDDFSLSGDFTINPEPTNYPTGFSATATGLSANLGWTDSQGPDLPDGYIILAGTNPSFSVPVDGTPIADDPDLSDGTGALNVAFGVEEGSFSNLEGNTTYYFIIYPYANSGSNIDYKTNGTAPTAQTTTANINTINSENFEDGTLGTWWQYSVASDHNWMNGEYSGNKYATVNGYGADEASDDWLISPALNLDEYDTEILTFETAKNFDDAIEGLEIKISEDYTGSGDPYLANWTVLPATLSAGTYVWTPSGDVDISSFSGQSVYIAFHYMSTGTASGEATVWEVDNILITGEGDIIVDPEPSNYPTDFEATAGTSFITLNWTDATGTQLPDSYIIFAGTDETLPVPADGIPVLNDTDFSDGSGAMNVPFGMEQYSFSGLEAATIYYFSIYSYTNSGSNVDFKTDGTAPTANAQTILAPEPTNYPTAFEAVAVNSSINLSWTDAIGTQLPENYLIFAGTDASLPIPVDGTPIPDDTNLSDGSGALNVAFGVEEASFGNLNPETTYYFSIYSYTNSGVYIDYKTNGTAPTANATTSYSPIIEFENFDVSWGGWTTISVTGQQVWDRNNTYGLNNTPCARMSGYSGGAIENEDWLISPALNLNNYDNAVLTFYNAMSYDGDPLQLKVSTDYTGSGNPNNATWTSLTYNMSPGFFEWAASGEIDISGFSGSAVYVAFQYTSNNTEASTWEVDDILIEEIVTLPEPTNYPTNFSATATGTTINLSWTDATGTQLPENYLIYAGVNSSLPVPADGTPVPNDTDLSDGSGALNIAYGVETTSFSGLDPATTYYFSIYSYTNSASAIDYKNDGTAPTADATTSNVNIVTIEYENFDDSWGNWTTISVTGSEVWDRNNTYGINNTPCAKMSGYNSGYFANEDWLISPALNLYDYENEKLTFYNASNYSGPDLELKVSTDYTGSGNPNNANWTNLSYIMSTGSFTWTLSGEVDLAGFNGNAVYVAFKYTSTTSAAKTWEVDEILITGEEETTIDPEPSNYPTNFVATASGTTIYLNWDDAIGTQLPDKYLVYAGTNSNLPVPVDGTPVPDDTDLSDGAGALNINYGVEEASFSGLDPAATYYFSIYSYTNSGVNIDFKNDGTAPTANATTSNVVTVTIEYENFDDSWGNWTTISVTGSEVWDRNNSYGINNSPCAKMSGYNGGYLANEDWLISPALNLSDYENEILTFYNAANYSGPDLELKISTDYSGSGNPNSANWTNLSYIMSSGSFTWTLSGEVDLSGFNESAVYVAFKYTSTTSAAKTWEVDEILITGEEEYIIQPEPTNYPQNFTATPSGTSITLTWDDATGTQLPDQYLIYAGTEASLPIPVDGTSVPDDTDLSDGSGALNIEYGDQEASFGNLGAATTYYFAIYPYTNNGANTDYKNDGSAPTAQATTGSVIVVTIEYQNFDVSWGNWTTVSVTGSEVWDRNNTYGINNSPCAKMSGYNGGYLANEDWLISPGLNLDDYENEKLTFYNAANYSGPDMELKVSTDYSGSGNPNSATWTNLSYIMSSGSFTWTLSGEVDLSGFNGNAVYVAFKYTSTTSAAKTWEVDEVMITGEEEYIVQPEPTNYPNNFEANAAGTSIVLNWDDATGDQLPDAYIIFAGTNSQLPVPFDGSPVVNDLDLSDGSGALNVDFGQEEAIFANLSPTTTYYFSIYPYTNSGANTDYKNDGEAPTADASTGYSPVIEYQNFSNGWGNWTVISVMGSQQWVVDNNYGFPEPPCARVSGYAGQSYENDDWLISPPMNLDNYNNEILTFYNAKSYTGPDMTLKVSTNYDGGGDPYTATWTTLSFEISPGFFEWTESGEIDLSGFNGSTVYVAFNYTSTNADAATWEIDEILIEDNSALPEPTNYPTGFAADANGTTIHLSWNDATGFQIPEAYLIVAGTSDYLPIPQDGVPVANDGDLSDGTGTLNVNYGVEDGAFSSLDPNTTHYFAIYPYTNSGQDINYKTDGTAPTANAATANVVEVTIEFENFNDGWGDWTPISVTGAQQWTRDNSYGINNSPCAQMSGYEGQAYENDDWLISPAMNFNNTANEKLIFYNAKSYTGPDLQVKISTDYDGGGDPLSATWVTKGFTMSPGFFEWTLSGDIDLSEFDGSSVYVAFHFTSTTSQSATWEIDEIKITGDEEYIIQPEPTNYPESFAATGLGLSVKTTWTDATGATLPSGYVIFANTSETLTVPVDGVPIQVDSDLGDGEAAVYVDYDEESFTFNKGLVSNTTYYFAIYSFTNSGSDINYKTDGTPPTANAKTTNVVDVTIEYENFDQGWGLWTPVSVEGAQQWTRDNSYGINYSPCAQMSGYEGQAYQNDDWLISPPMDFSKYLNERLTFQNAKSYTGPDLEVKVSEDYDGNGDPNAATWTTKSFTMSSGFFEWTSSGEIDISDFNGENVYVAFHFTSTSSQSATWELDEIEITGQQETGIGELSEVAGNIRVYPNPATDNFFIDKQVEGFNSVRLLTVSGLTVAIYELTGNSEWIDVSGLQKGMYFVAFTDPNKGTVTKKLIIR
ncbi:MAG: choice-of-anchor J domain-containing protein [Bacteroidales bacterium]|nr:choice-of-anchor J domain-containing protein [Bacteroidales bacterium]